MQDTKKVAGELLVELEKKGVTFETVDGKLKYKDSKGNFTENSKEKVKKYKEEIIEILKKKQTIDEFITDNDYETNVYPLTDVQAAYLVGKTEAVKWGGIGCKGYIEVDFGSYSAEELSRAWKVLVNRHEMLRAKVTEVGFEILERDEIDYEIKIVNLQKMAEREKVDTLSKIREDFSEYVFHTEEPPLFKVLITKRIEGNFFHLLVDLIVSDFASVQLLISEMGELLKGASLEKIRYKFSDYAMFNQQRKGSLKWHQDRMYWLERLKKLPEAPILPQDGRAADKCENTYEFYRFQKHINQSDWKRIKEIAGEYGVTVSSVLIGIYAEVISRWSSNKHFTLNLPIQNRPTIGNNTNSIVGDFTAVNLLEVNVTQNMSFIERVKEITKRLMEDLEHNSFSGVEVLRELSKVSEEKELLMPIVFTGVLKTDGTVGTIEYGFSHTPQVWIDCQIVDEIDSEDQEKGLMISWDTRKGAIKESIVTEMFESFTETIRILGIKHSEEWKNPLEIIVPSASKKKVICERNKGITNQSRIQQRFVKYAKKNSNKTAVIDAVETVTYGELLERAEYIAGYLRKEFVENRTGLVAIRMKKSVNQIAAVMGVLIAGFSYLPIDIKQPLARQEKILSKANVIVELDEKKVNMILQNLEYRLEKHPEFQNPIAYVIFTSGSTGEPKGVVMSHTAAQNTLISIENMYNISEEDTILGIAELSFDLSVFDIFSVLGVGGTLVLPNPEKGPDASHWGRLLNEYKVTLWNSVPAQAEMLDAFASKSESYPTVRLVLLSGDWINTSLPGRLRKIMTNAQMISLGGATEGGIWSIYHEIDEIEERPTKSILAKGIPTLLEHPAHEVEIVNCIRESGSAAFMLNPFYRYIKPIRDFLEAAQIISKHAHLINASLECAIHVLYDGIDILGCALGGLSTWKLGNVAESYTTSMAGGGNRVISGIIGMVPVTFIVNTNVDRNDIDHPLHLYHRIELTFSTGRLCLVNTHGPVIWLPFLHMPRDEYGTLSINVEEEVNIPSGVTIGNVMLPSVKETFEQIWPDAVKKALEILFKQNRTEKMSMAQYQIYVSKLWSEICQKVGYMNIVDYDNFGDIKSIFYDLEKRHLIKKENDGIE